jgi:hypothetical protein
VFPACESFLFTRRYYLAVAYNARGGIVTAWIKSQNEHAN